MHIGICLCGWPQAGKTHGARVISDHFSAQVISVESLIKRNSQLGGSVEDVLSRIASERQGDTSRILSVWSTERSDGHRITLIDGLYSEENRQALDGVFDAFVLVYIRTCEFTRAERAGVAEDEYAEQIAPLKETTDLAEIIEEERYDIEVGNDLASAFDEKLLGEIDGVIHNCLQEARES